MHIIADGLLKETLIRANTFGVTLVELDIRQSSDKQANQRIGGLLQEHLGETLTEELEAKSHQVEAEEEPVEQRRQAGDHH